MLSVVVGVCLSVGMNWCGVVVCGVVMCGWVVVNVEGCVLMCVCLSFFV